MIENNRSSTTREIAEKFNISHTCVERHLKQLGYVNKLDIWVPHKLNEIQLTKRISICDSLLKRNEINPFLKRIITGDEKCVVYDNVVRKRLWSNRDEPAQSSSKADIDQKKVMLRPHTSLVTRKKLLELGWEVMSRPPYSPDLAPSDYHLFRSLPYHLNGKTFDSNEAVKNELIQFSCL